MEEANHRPAENARLPDGDTEHKSDPLAPVPDPVRTGEAEPEYVLPDSQGKYRDCGNQQCCENDLSRHILFRFEFPHRPGQFRKDLKEIADNAIAGKLEYGGIGILVDGYDHTG